MAAPVNPAALRRLPALRNLMVRMAAVGVATAGFTVALAYGLAAAVAGFTGLEHVSPPLQPWLLVALAVAGRWLLSWWVERDAHISAWRIIGSLRLQVLSHVQRVGPVAVGRSRASEITESVATGLDSLDGYITKFLPQLAYTATITPLLVAVGFWLDPLSGVIFVLTLPLIPVFMALVGWLAQADAERRLVENQSLSANLLDLVAGLPTLHAAGRAPAQVEALAAVSERSHRSTVRTLRTAFLSSMVLELLASLSVAIVAVNVGLRLMHDHIAFVPALAVLILAPDVYLPLRNVGMHFHASTDGVAALNNAMDLLALPAPSGTASVPDLAEGAQLQVRVNDLSHQYAAEATGPAPYTPFGLSFTLRSGRITALHGPNGAGKSTAAAALAQYVQPNRGTIAVQWPGHAERSLADLDALQWRAQISYCAQNPALVAGSIAQNVGWRRLNPTDPASPIAPPDDVARAARLTGLDAVIATLPQGWATPVSDLGLGVSAGQRHRIALTRALVQRRPLVIVDEPTAHLDTVSETELVQALRALADAGSAVLLISHREATLACADERVEVTSR